MEWFKHKTGSLDDPDFNAILDEFGSDGYMMFFGLLEIYGREFSNTDPEGFLSVRLAFVARKLRKSSAKVEKFLSFCGKSINKPRFIHSINGTVLTYKVPDFIEMASNWTKRTKQTPTEAPTEAPTAIEVEEEVEEERDKEKKKPIEHPSWLNLPLWKEFKKYRTKIKAPLTDHAEKLCIADLKKVIDSGHDQGRIINQTIMSGKWKSFFAVKGKIGTSTQSTYNFPECGSCGAKASSIKKGKKCPFCDEIV